MKTSLIKVLLSFIIVAFGIPSLSGYLSLAAAFGYALFWNGAFSLKKHRFWVATIWFACVQAVQLNWMVSTEYMGHGILVVYLFVVVALGLQFALLTSLIRLPLTWMQILGLSGFWVLMEWVRLFFLSGFAWNPIGLTLAANTYSLQMASLFGIYGLCFWVIFVNLAALKQFFSKKGSALWLVLALTPYGYGFAHKTILERSLSQETDISVALVQTAILPEQRDSLRGKQKKHIHPLIQWDRILTHLETLKNKKIDLIVFSEGAIPNSFAKVWVPPAVVQTMWKNHFGEEAVVNFPPQKTPFGDGKKVSNAFWMQALANHFQAEIIAGLDDREQGRLYNTAFHFSPKSAIEKYQKQILIPVGEYIPFSDWTWFKEFIMETFGMGDSFSSGSKTTIFEGKIPIGVHICLEETYSHLVRKIRQKGAKLFVNLTNDVWFPNTRLPWHHFEHGRIRAVENGVCMLRATNTGVTAAIDCFGDTLAIFPPSESGVLETTVKIRFFSTLYTFLGDTPIICLSGILFGFIWVDRMRRKKTLP